MSSFVFYINACLCLMGSNSFVFYINAVRDKNEGGEGRGLSKRSKHLVMNI